MYQSAHSYNKSVDIINGCQISINELGLTMHSLTAASRPRMSETEPKLDKFETSKSNTVFPPTLMFRFSYSIVFTWLEILP